MSLYKQPGSEIWWADVANQGERHRFSTGETNHIAAKRVHDERKAALWKITPALKGKTWNNAIEKWLDKADRSYTELLGIKKFNLFFPDRRLSAITPEAVDEALSKFCKTGATYTRHRARVSGILNLSGISIKLETRKVKKKARTWLTHEQWAALYSQLPLHMKPMAEFAIETGLRQANVLGLTWNRVDIRRRMLWIEAEDMKGGAAVGIPLSTGALRVLQAQSGKHPEFVFTYQDRPIEEIKTAFSAACIRAGVGRMVDGAYSGFTWHGFRHTWATWHVQNGTPLDVLQKLGAWKSYQMVLIYAHHSPGHLAGFADNAKEK